MLRPFHIVLLSFICLTLSVYCKDNNEKPDWAKKDIRDYNDADLERLLEQWEEGDEPLPEDEKPEYLRQPPKIDMSKLDFSNPEQAMKLSKQGKTLMMFVSVSGSPSQQETETITSIWQSSLQNSHIIAERFMIDGNRAIFMFKDGSQAWDAKDFLIEQDRCQSVSIEGQVFPGKNNAHTEL